MQQNIQEIRLYDRVFARRQETLNFCVTAGIL